MAERNTVKHHMETLSEPTVGTENQKQQKIKGGENWRLSVLSKPRVFTPKYEKPADSLDSGVRPEALLAPPKEREDQMSIPPLRLLYYNKRTYAGNPYTNKNYSQIMDKQIDRAWNSIYNEYRKARRDKRLKELERQARRLAKSKKAKKAKGKKEKPAKKGKGKKKEAGGKKEGKKGEKKDEDDTSSVKSEDSDKQLQHWIDKISLPKPIPEPEPIKRGPIVKLDDIKERIDTISQPTQVREKYVPKKPPKHIVSIGALNYEPTERILEIAKPPAYRLKKESVIELGAVSPAALKYKTTERDEKLATPRVRANVNDNDLKEDPFSISKNAMKYKATPRIIELAKPVDRK